MIVAAGSAIVVLMVSWWLRPKPIARASGRRRAPLNMRAAMAPVGIVVAIGLTVMAPLAGVATITAAATWRRWSIRRRAQRVARQISADYPDALDLLVLSIRAGYLPAQAMVEITPFLPPSLCTAYTAVDQAVQEGARFADALGELVTQLGPIAQPLVDSLSSADRYGLPLTPVLERLAFEARQQRRREADASARELPVRLAVPLVVCTLPSFVLLAIVPLLLGALSSLRT